MGQQMKVNRQGYTAGVPDLFIYEPRGPFSGLAIEFKSANGRLNPKQVEFIEKLNARGYRAEVARSVEEAKSICQEYLDVGLDFQTDEVGGQPWPIS